MNLPAMDPTVLLSIHFKQYPKIIKFFHGNIEQFLLQKSQKKKKKHS
jgi:hypothetical protein